MFRTHPMDKPEVLARVLQAKGGGRAMVFCRTKRNVDTLTSDLAERGFTALAVHGDLGQDQREKALRSFRSGKADVLVATDVAARGLDVDDVTHVVNYACPDDDKDYLHRIGRTGRAGKEGTAVTFVDWEDTARWRVINDALDLPFPEPAETYSTSAHLYEDLDIPPGATGRIGPSVQTERAGRQGARQQGARQQGARQQGARQQGSRRQGANDVEETTSRPARRRNRQRTRTRAGQAVGGESATAEGSRETASAPSHGDASAGSAGSARHAGRDASGRTRRRRRGGRGRGSPSSGDRPDGS